MEPSLYIDDVAVPAVEVDQATSSTGFGSDNGTNRVSTFAVANYDICIYNA